MVEISEEELIDLVKKQEKLIAELRDDIKYLKSKLDIPCGRDMYYDRYRRFFWLLIKRAFLSLSPSVGRTLRYASIAFIQASLR